MDIGMWGTIRRFAKQSYGNARALARLTNFESLAVAQVESPGVEGNRAGRRFMIGNSAAITGIAPVQVAVTTAAQWAIWNAEPASGGRTFYFEELGMYLTSGTPGVGGALWACLYSLPASTGNSAAGVGVGPTGKTVGTPAIMVNPSATITTPAAPVWYPIGINFGANVTAFASSALFEHRRLEGRLSIPPQYGMGLAMVTPVGTSPLYAPFGTFLALDSDNE